MTSNITEQDRYIIDLFLSVMQIGMQDRVGSFSLKADQMVCSLISTIKIMVLNSSDSGHCIGPLFLDTTYVHTGNFFCDQRAVVCSSVTMVSSVQRKTSQWDEIEIMRRSLITSILITYSIYF